jgi:hypothetical protein
MTVAQHLHGQVSVWTINDPCMPAQQGGGVGRERERDRMTGTRADLAVG